MLGFPPDPSRHQIAVALPETEDGRVQPTLHRPQWDTDDLTDLLVGKPVIVGEGQDLRELVGHSLHDLADEAPFLFQEQVLFG